MSDNTQAQPPILEYEIDKNNTLEIDPVFSGAYIETQYLAYVDRYNQVCTNMFGNLLGIALSDNMTIINGVQRFVSTYGVYELSTMELYTNPSLTNLTMTVMMEPGLVKYQPYEYNLTFKLRVQRCRQGDEQI